MSAVSRVCLYRGEFSRAVYVNGKCRQIIKATISRIVFPAKDRQDLFGKLAMTSWWQLTHA